MIEEVKCPYCEEAILFNREEYMPKGTLQEFFTKCTSCGGCAKVSPKGVVFVEDETRSLTGQTRKVMIPWYDLLWFALGSFVGTIAGSLLFRLLWTD